jgi:alkanesulfonate monooxygenase SsuD/methylene tetrahydromethanopterin reductase-like flavin-dependent oxidoreductase (luciferase family)
MKVDGGVSFEPTQSARTAKEAEAAGYDGAWTAETSHDPFIACAIAAANTERLQVGTSIAVAFARSPMTTAVTANDLQLRSNGRFLLGLGSLIKPHIE